MLKRCLLFMLLATAVVAAQPDLFSRLLAESRLGDHPDHHRRCLLPVVLEAAAAPQDAPLKSSWAAYRQSLDASAQKTAQLEYLSPSGHFSINYFTQGTHAVPGYDRNGNQLPDFVEFAAIGMDRAWAIEVDSLGFNPPPNADGSIRTVYPVNLRWLGRGTYGLTDFDLDEDIPNRAGLNFPSEIFLNVDMSFVSYPEITGDTIAWDSLALAVTTAHEFNHALQLGYRFWEASNGGWTDLRLIEATATLMEEVVASEVNDYFMVLDSYFGLTRLNFEDTRVLYGDVVFYIMLSRLYGFGHARELWEEITARPGLEALEAILGGRGSSVEEELIRLAGWLGNSGSRTRPGRFFPDAAGFPDIPFNTTITLDGNDTGIQTVFQNELPTLAFEFLRIPVSPAASVQVLLESQGGQNAWQGVSLSDDDPFAEPFPEGIALNYDGGTFAEAVYAAVVKGAAQADTLEDYTFYARASQSDPAGRGNLPFAYPNPLHPGSRASEITIENLPTGKKVLILNGSGDRVTVLDPGPEGRRVFWDLNNSQNEPVASGVYLFVVDGEEDKNGKIMIVR